MVYGKLTLHSVVLHTHGPTARPAHTSSEMYNEPEPMSPCSSFSVTTGTLQEQPSVIIKHCKINKYQYYQIFICDWIWENRPYRPCQQI